MTRSRIRKLDGLEYDFREQDIFGRYEQHQAKQAQQLLPQYSSSKKSSGYSPSKQPCAASSTDVQTERFAIQLKKEPQTSNFENNVKLLQNQNVYVVERNLPSFQQTESHSQIVSSMISQSSASIVSPKTYSLTGTTALLGNPSSSTPLGNYIPQGIVSLGNMSNQSYLTSQPVPIDHGDLASTNFQKGGQQYRNEHSDPGVFLASSSRIDLRNYQSTNYHQPPNLSNNSRTTGKVIKEQLAFQPDYQQQQVGNFTGYQYSAVNFVTPSAATSHVIRTAQQNNISKTNDDSKYIQDLKQVGIKTTPLTTSVSGQFKLPMYQQTPSSKTGLQTASAQNRASDQLVQSVNLMRNRSQSPAQAHDLKQSTNNGSAYRVPYQIGLSKNPSLQAKFTQVQSYPNQICQPIPLSSNGNSSHSDVSILMELKNNSPDHRHNVPATSTISFNTGNSLPQSYYKVASQIRRNHVKEIGGKISGQGSSQERRGLSNGLLQIIPGSSLTQSQNCGRVGAHATVQQQFNQLPSRSPVNGFKRQKSNGSVDSSRQLNSEGGDSRKRFAGGEKLNEKYTKKMRIDLCNFMDDSQEGGGVQTQGSAVVERDNLHQSSSGKSGTANLNQNMHMLDILSQQRVLQRSVSNSKRVGGQIVGIKGTDKIESPSKQNSAGTKRLSFRFSEKPWENNSFNSRYGSFSAMRSNGSSSQVQNAQQPTISTWQLAGESISNLTESVVKQTSNEMSSMIRLAAGESIDTKNLISGGQAGGNTFILKGFNDSQEIHSSRNLGMGGNGVHSWMNSRSSKQAGDKRNILTKNITSADLTSTSPSPSVKYKFTNNHLSKPSTSSTSFSNQKQQQPSLSSRSQHKDEIDSLQRVKSTSITQSGSPAPNSSHPSSKNSTKCEIKKSLINDSNSRSSQQKDRSSSNTYSNSFDKEPQYLEHEDNKERGEGESHEGVGFEDEQNSRFRENDQLDADDHNFNQDDSYEQQEEEEEEVDLAADSSSLTSERSGEELNKIQAFQNQINTAFQTTGTILGGPPRHLLYNFDIQLEMTAEVAGLNIEEMKKERTKLIRKIASTFKVKNKALSTSQEYYKMLQVIGKGAFAKVCLAVQLLTGKLVAIKLIDKQILRSDSAKKRVLQEVQILKKLSGHKNVLRLLEVFENRKLIFIVTEYFPGSDLMKLMKERNGQPFSENKVRTMLTQILSGLRYVHGNMVLHRDIKLDNMLVDKQLNLKIIDFGISRVILRDQRMTEQCGTPAFLAPEIIANKGYEGFGSDFWSLGVLLYILLFGRVPFKGNNLCELHKNILSGVLPREEMRETSISQEAQDLLLKLLRVKVKERIDLESIVNSPWMRGFPIPDGTDTQSENSDYNSSKSSASYQSQSMKTSQAMPNDQYDERVIGFIESFGYSREYILRCLSKGNLSHVNAIYKVLKRSSVQ